MAIAAAFSASGAALVATLPADGLVRVVSARDLRERFRYLLPGAYFATLCGDTSLLAVAATHGTVRVPSSSRKCTWWSWVRTSRPRSPVQAFLEVVLLLVWDCVGAAPACGGPGRSGPTWRPARALACRCSASAASASWAAEFAGSAPRAAQGPLQCRPQCMCVAAWLISCPPQRHRVLLVNAAKPRGSVFAEFAVSERVLRVLMSPTR